MKTIEEKAKAYDEAMERAIVAYKDTDRHIKATIERIFPDLKESEDERMMWDFNDWLCEEIECRTNDLRDEKDRRTLNMLCYILTKVKNWLEKQKEQEFAPKTFEDAVKQMYDEVDVCQLKWKERAAKLFELARKELEQNPVEWSEEDDAYRIEAVKLLENPSLYESCSNLRQETIEWLKQLPKVSVNSEQVSVNSEWSEEDEKILADTIFKLAGFMGNEKNIAWLKSLRPSWKPSEEQLKELNFARLGRTPNVVHEHLDSLYNDLLKLK